jgi:hypothetical protein
MRCHRVLIMVSVTLLIFNLSVNAQIDISSISVKIGSIGTFQTDVPYASALNPEIEVGGLFLTKYFNWGLCWSYWDDGLNEIPWTDSPVYNYSSHILGCRLSLSLTHIDDNWIIPIHVFAGIAEHFVKTRCLSAGWGGTDGDYSRSITTAELGLSLPINIVGAWNILAEAQIFLPFNRSEQDQMKRNRMALKIGLNYLL